MSCAKQIPYLSGCRASDLFVVGLLSPSIIIKFKHCAGAPLSKVESQVHQ